MVLPPAHLMAEGSPCSLFLLRLFPIFLLFFFAHSSHFEGQTGGLEVRQASRMFLKEDFPVK